MSAERLSLRMSSAGKSMYEELDPNKIAAEFLSTHIDTLFEAGKTIVKDTRDKFRLRLDKTYRTYFTHLLTKYSQTKSFLLRGEPVPLYDFYVPLQLLPHGPAKKAPFPGDIRVLLSKAKNITITGSAGSGKSMLLRHLLLDALRTKTRVPVFIELRQFNAGVVDLPAMVRKTLATNKFDLEDAYIDKALKVGHFLLFLDGFDEVAPKMRNNVTTAIATFVKEYDDNAVVMTSRPDPALEGWDGFSIMRVAPLSKADAISLVGKLPFDEPLKRKFSNDLRSHLYEEHRSFLSNPLLLSIMLLSYGQSASIPSKLSVFYNQAYEALFERHDALKDGFQRERQTLLDIQDFGRIFAAFSLRSYDKRKLEFTTAEALEYVQAAEAMVGVSCPKKDYLHDAIDAVALLVQDGLQIVYAHRSFQEYFAARFICEARPKIQEQLLKRYTRNRELVHSDNVLNMIYEMRPDLVEAQYLIPELERFFAAIKLRDSIGPQQHERFIRLCFGELMLTRDQIFSSPAQSDDAALFLAVVVFVLSKCSEFGDSTMQKERLSAEKEILQKYLGADASSSQPKRIAIATDPLAADLIADLATVPNSWYSLDALKALRTAYRELVEKARRGQESIDEILKAR